MSTRIFRTVVMHMPSLVVGVFVSFVVLTLVTVIPNSELLSRIVADPAVSMLDKVHFFGSLYGSLFTNHSLLSGSIAVMISILSGVQASLVMYYISLLRHGRFSRRITYTSVGGMIAGLLGVGCAACGSVILTAVLAGAGSTLLLLLPFGGAELGFLGIALLLYAIVKMHKEIAKGSVCTIT